MRFQWWKINYMKHLLQKTGKFFLCPFESSLMAVSQPRDVFLKDLGAIPQKCNPEETQCPYLPASVGGQELNSSKDELSNTDDLIMWINLPTPPFPPVLSHQLTPVFKNAHLLTFPPTVQECSLFSTPSPAFIVSRFSDDGHSDQCEVIPHCSFDLHFSND